MTKWGILVPAALVTLFFMASCQQPDLSGYALKTDLANSSNASGVCLTCHVNGTTYGLANASATMNTGYLTSGHGEGALRERNAGIYEFGSTVVENDAGCSKCHTTQGFNAWTVYGPAPIVIGATTQPSDIANTSIIVNGGGTSTPLDAVSCFACHDPHSQLTMGLRVIKNVSLPSGMTGIGSTATTVSQSVYLGGKGNLCANCHQDRTTANKLNAFFTLTGTNYTSKVKFTNRLAHHGVQADFMMSLDSAGYTTATAVAQAAPVASVPATSIALGYPIPIAYNGIGGAQNTIPTFALNGHYSAWGTGSPSDGCITCHLGTTKNHGMYLTTASGDDVSSCVVCHLPGSAVTIGGALNSNVSYTGYTDLITGSSLITNIEVAKKTLLGFFGNKFWFFATAASAAGSLGTSNTNTTALVLPAANTTGSYTVGTYNEYVVDWKVNPAAAGTYMTSNTAKAFWNFILFTEDRSRGVHNPKYAAELLYDAIALINADTEVNTSAGFSLLSQPAAWASRP